MIVVSVAAVLIAACGVLIPWPPDFDGRARRIQMIAFGREVVPGTQRLAAHESSDQRNLTWLYRVRPEQREQLFRRCVRPAEATNPYRAFRIPPRPPVPGCVIWEGTHDGSQLTILLSETTLELREVTARPVPRGW